MATKIKRKLKRNNRLFFDLSDEELKVFNDRFSGYKSTNRSEFIRDSVLNNYIIINDDKNLRSLVYEINKIGNNINQLTHLANQNKIIEKEEIEILKNEMEKVKSRVFKTLMKHNEKR